MLLTNKVNSACDEKINFDAIAFVHPKDWRNRRKFSLKAHLQLSLSNALQIPLGSKFLTDLSTFKRLHFGMLYYTIFALILILLNLILFTHCLLLNSTSSWKLTFFFIPILLSLSSFYWTDPLELWFGVFVIHYSFHILHPRSVHLLNSC